MPLQFTETKRQLMEMYSSPTLKEKENSQFTSMEATALTMNSTVAAAYRLKAKASAEVVNKYNGMEFNRENLGSALNEQNFSPTVRDRVLTTSYSGGWQAALNHAESLKNLENARKQVDEELSTAQILLLGGATSLVDPISIATGATAIKGASYLANFANIVDKASESRYYNTIRGATAGAIYGAADMATYETVTGEFNENSLVNSALLGLGLGAGIGVLIDRMSSVPDVSYVNKSTNKPVTPQEATEIELEATVSNLNAIDNAIEAYRSVKLERADITKQLVNEEAAIKGRAKFDVDNATTGEAVKLSTTQKAIAELETFVKDIPKKLASLTRQSQEAAKAPAKLEAKASERASIESSLAQLTKTTAPIKGQLTKANNALQKLDKEAPDYASKAAALNTKISDLNKTLKVNNAKQTKLARDLEKNKAATKELSDKYSAKEVDRINKEREDTLKARESLPNQLSKAIADRDLARQEYDDAVAAREQLIRGKTTNPEVKALKKQFKALGYNLSPEGFAKMLRDKGVAEKQIQSLIENGVTNLKGLRAVRKEQKSLVKKLEKELSEIITKQGSELDLTIPETFKKAHPLLAKVVISPVENLLKSANEKVVGLTLLLHSGTLHHGLVSNVTAWAVRTKLDTRLNRANKSVINNYREAIKDGSFNGNFKEFSNQVGDNAYASLGRMERELADGIEGTITGAERRAILKEKVAAIKRDYASDNKWVNKSLDDYLDYYEEMFALGQKLNMQGFKDSFGKLYIPRVYSAEGIEKIGGRDAAINHLIRAQEAYAIAHGSKIESSVFAEKAAAVVDGTINKELRYKQTVEDLGLPPESTPDVLKLRGIDAFTDDLAPLLDNNMEGVSILYGLKMHGRLALKQKLGVESEGALEALIQSTGASVKEADNLRVMVQTIIGNREIVRNPYKLFNRFVRGASTFSSAMHTLGFVVPTLTEASAIAAQFGWGRTIDRLIGSPQEIYNIYRNGLPSDKNQIELAISYSDGYFANRVSRVDVESNLFATDKVEHFMNDIVAKEAVFGGLLPVTDMLRITTASLSVDFLARLSVAKRITKQDMMRLNDMGISAEDLPTIKERLAVQPDGRIGNMDRNSWGDLDDKIAYAVMNMTERTILHPNGITLPKFMSDVNGQAFLPMVMFKFMRFPFESHERLLLRGIQEADGKLMLGLAGNIGMWSLILMAKDATKEEEKQKYSGEDGMNLLMIDSFLMNSVTAGSVSALDMVSGTFTGETLGGYRSNFGSSVLGVVGSDVQKAIEGRSTLSLPFYSAPVGDAIKTMMQDIGLLEELNK